MATDPSHPAPLNCRSLALTVMQILAIDLGAETLLALALGREPPEPDIMERPPRRRGRRILDRPMLVRACLWLGLVKAALVTAGFLWVLTSAGWSPGEVTGEGSALHDAYLAATTMTFAGIAACQIALRVFPIVVWGHRRVRRWWVRTREPLPATVDATAVTRRMLERYILPAAG